MTENRCELSAMISDNFEITCLKWLKITHAHQLSQVLQMKISFFSHTSFLYTRAREFQFESRTSEVHLDFTSIFIYNIEPRKFPRGLRLISSLPRFHLKYRVSNFSDV